jgi:hypothetical protein
MHIVEFKEKGAIFKRLRQNPSFLAGLRTKEDQIRAIEKESGVFNVILVIGGAESGDLVFAREQIVIQEINTYKGVVPVITYSTVGYDLIDSRQLVLVNKTNADICTTKKRSPNPVVSFASFLAKQLNRGIKSLFLINNRKLQIPLTMKFENPYNTETNNMLLVFVCVRIITLISIIIC